MPPKRTTDTQAARRAHDRLHGAIQALLPNPQWGGEKTPCRQYPDSWIGPTGNGWASAHEVTRCEAAAQRCLSCPALEMCRDVRAADPDLARWNVLAGEVPDTMRYQGAAKVAA